MSNLEKLFSNPGISNLVKDAVTVYQIKQKAKADKAVAIINQELDSIDADIQTMVETGKLAPGWKIFVHGEDCAYLTIEKPITKRIGVMVNIGPEESIVVFCVNYDRNVEKIIRTNDFGGVRDETNCPVRNGHRIIIR